MSWYGKKETWKIVYYPVNSIGGARGVALVEAENRPMAMFAFQDQYKGQYTTVKSCEKLIK